MPHERRILQSASPRFGSAVYTKSPNESLGFGVEYTNDLAVGDTLSSSTWQAPGGLSLGSSYINQEPTPLQRRVIPAQHLAVVSIGGGTANRFYDVTNVVVTAFGETMERRFRIHVKQSALL